MIHPIMAGSFLLFSFCHCVNKKKENNYFQSLRKSRVPHKKINFFIIIGGKKGCGEDVNSSISLEYSKIPRTPGAQRSSRKRAMNLSPIQLLTNQAERTITIE